MEDWGEEIFAEGTGVKWKKWARGIWRGGGGGEGGGEKEYACPKG